jgi:ATP-dependent DNA helicase RecQ
VETKSGWDELGIGLEQARHLTGRQRRRLLDFAARWHLDDLAYEYVTALLTDEPNLVTLLDTQAKALLALGRSQEALQVLEARHALKMSLSSQMIQARCHLAMGDAPAALAIARQMISDNPESLTAWTLLGDLHCAQGAFAEAWLAYRRLDELRPAGRAHLLGMLALHRAQGNWVTASGYAVKLEASAEDGERLPIYLRQVLAEYYQASGEPIRAADHEQALQTLYREDLDGLRGELLTGASPAVSLRPHRAAPAAELDDEEAGAMREFPPVVVPESERQELERAAFELFGYDGLLPGQAETMSSMRAGRDVLTVLPTGGGKSLCYQLPALIEKTGTTLVISPLIALMKDQVDSLPEAARKLATSINSSLDGDELRQRLRQIAQGRYRLVYAAPERLRQPTFLHALRSGDLRRLVVDEAHCVSMWGHDFRPDYLYIGQARRLLGDPPVLAMTATAPTPVRRDIVNRIGGADGMTVVSGEVCRPNLYLETKPVRNVDEKLAWVVAICQGEPGSGIVYVNARAHAEELAALLQARGVSAGYYHAGMGDGAVRSAAQDAFMSGSVRVMVATIAFGLGIDKADIRFVLHFDPPSSLEAYYQEAGRAGRDGLPARCVLLHSAADQATLTKRAKRDALTVEDLRVVYGAVRSRLAGQRLGRVAMGDLQRDCDAEETQVRVALSLLEEAELLQRLNDAPRTVVLGAPEGAVASRQADDPDLERLLGAVRLQPGERVALDAADVARSAGLDLEQLEERLLDWGDRGYLSCRTSGRDLLLELVPPPAQAAERVEAVLERYAVVATQRIAEVTAYARTRKCRHGHISGYLGGRVISHCGQCDSCRPPAPVDPSSYLPGEREQMMVILRCLQATPWGWGPANLSHILRGDGRATPSGSQSPYYGTLAYRSEAAVDKLVAGLADAGLLRRKTLENGGCALELTEEGRRALAKSAECAPGA